jgi:hypothetical protein
VLSQAALDAPLRVVMASAVEVEAKIRLVAEGIASQSEMLEMFHKNSLGWSVAAYAEIMR